MTDTYSPEVKKEALMMAETISLMDHLIKTYGLLFSDADFAAIREGLHALSNTAERISRERRHGDLTL